MNSSLQVAGGTLGASGLALTNETRKLSGVPCTTIESTATWRGAEREVLIDNQQTRIHCITSSLHGRLNTPFPVALHLPSYTGHTDAKHHPTDFKLLFSTENPPVTWTPLDLSSATLTDEVRPRTHLIEMKMGNEHYCTISLKLLVCACCVVILIAHFHLN